PVRLHFGKDILSQLGEVVAGYGQNVMLMYGKGSIKNNGVYSEIIKQLNSVNSNIIEYQGIKANPVIDDVEKATEIGIEKKVDVIIAAGGGSVIDSAKITSLCIQENLDPWKVLKVQQVPTKSVPVIVVLTIAATGSEMNPFSVVQNHETGEKSALHSELIFPAQSFLDPQYTCSLPADQTSYGISDLIAHSFEAWFGEGEARLSDNIVASVINEAKHYAPLLLNDLTNYNYRANIMWAATIALNGNTIHGRKSGDWAVHAIGHQLSYLFDTAHGATLSIVYPAWFKLMKDRIPDRIKALAEKIFNTNDIDKFISELENFYRSINCPVRLSEAGISSSEKDLILEYMLKNKVNGYHYKLTENDYINIVDLML
ncbi:iron-containing alcohol dehydrogenase, partial [Bacteroidota bacterium]